VSATIAIRPARAEDAAALRRLAALDSAPVPSAPVLLLEEGGEARAARSLHDGAVVADPFYRTLELVALLEVRAEQLRQLGPGRPGGGRGIRARARRVRTASTGGRPLPAPGG